MKILVVDDSRTMRKVIRGALEQAGHAPEDLVEAGNGLEAIAELEKPNAEFDLVLADWNMPEMDGLALLKNMKTTPELRGIAVIMVTSESERAKVVEAISAGANSYIAKPFTAETLARKVLTIERSLISQRKPSQTSIVRIKTGTIDSEANTFLDSLSDEVTRLLQKRSLTRTFPAGAEVIEDGDEIESLIVIVSGEVEILLVSGNTKLSRGRGECIGALSFLSGEKSKMKVVTTAESEIAFLPREDYEVIASEQAELSMQLTKFVARYAREADKQALGADSSGIRGSLDMMSLTELLQALHASRKEGTLEISGAAGSGKLHLREGEITHAVTGSYAGEEAFYQLVGLKEGGFVLQGVDPEAPQTITTGTMSLLLEGMRRLDEASEATQG